MPQRIQVSGADAAWLHMDQAHNPMMITGVMWFDGPLRHEALLDVLQDRVVDRYPKFGWKLVRDGDRHAWTPDPRFELQDHVHRIQPPAPGGREGMQRLVSQLLSTRLDPDRPLWHVDHVEDFDGGSAIVVRIHHVIADGISLARVLLSLADDHDDEETLEDRPRLSAVAGLTRAVRTAWRTGASWLADPDRLREVARLGASGAGAATELLTMPADPDTALRGELGIRKHAAWTPDVDLERVKRIGRGLDATVNDVLLAALTLALRRYLLDRGTPVDEVRTFVPVNLRPLDRPLPRDLGNQFGLVLLGLPLDRDDPREVLAELKRRMDAIKASPQAVLTWAVLQTMSAGPDLLEHAVVDVFRTKASLITTNVPGPRQPLRVAGARVAGMMFWVPQSAGLGLGVSIFSYCGTVRVGIAADAHLVPDVEALVTAWLEALDALEAA